MSRQSTNSSANLLVVASRRTNYLFHLAPASTKELELGLI